MGDVDQDKLHQGELGQDIDRDVSCKEDEVYRAHTCHIHNAP